MTGQWRKSSHSGGATDSACVEVAGLADGIGIRDSKAPDGERLFVAQAGFGVLLRQIKEGSLDRPA